MFERRERPVDGQAVQEVLRIPPELGSGQAMMYQPEDRVFALSERYELSRAGARRVNGRDCLKIQFRLEGRASFRFDNRRLLELAPFEAAIVLDGSEVEKDCYVQPGVTSTIMLGCDAEFLSRYFDGDCRDLPRQIRQFLSSNSMNFYCASVPMTPSMVAASRALLVSTHTGVVRRAYFQAKIVELLCDMFQSLGGAETQDRMPARVVAQLEAVRERIHQQFALPLTVPELAHAVGTNESKLSRLFRERYGVPVYEYLRNVRLNRARELLRSPDYSITDIALLVGYEHPANFATAFRRQFGISPRQVRVTSTQ